ncbi:MAG: hypothetical protein RMJ97_05525 [Raineya sp.]|nr:hypothetical protein [Raineya sp.]
MQDLQLIESHLQKNCEEFSPQNLHSWEDLRNYLLHWVQNLLQKAPERLLQVAYRLDLPENEFSEAFAKQDSPRIVEIMLQRELKRLEFRKKYS